MQRMGWTHSDHATESNLVDWEKLSRIGHTGIAFAAPISVEKISAIDAMLPLSSETSVLDIGCGRAEWLIGLVERYGVQATGVDQSSGAIAEARAQAARRVPDGAIELIERDAAQFDVAPESFDLALCVGSSHAFGGYRETLRALGQWVKPGGHLIMGEGFWQREPDQEY